MIKKTTFFILVGMVLIGSTVKGQITFAEHIAPLIYSNCTECHRQGEIGPMPLSNYEEIKNWGEMIEYVTSIRYMPPWKPDRKFSKFLGERYLKEDEIQMISEWVADGMPRGDVAMEPNPPTFPSGSQVGEPDLVLSFKEPYTHKGNNQDQYQVFVLPTGLSEDRVLKAIELRPGNRRIVHHALFGSDITGEARILDEETPAYGYTNFGDFGVDLADNYPGYVPGAKPRVYPENVGQVLQAGSDLLIQMHYAPVPSDEQDSSTVNIFFADEEETIDRFVQFQVMLPFGRTLTNGPFFINANQKKTFHGVWTIPKKVSVLGVGPHMHLLGRDWTVLAISPEGDTTNMINIPDWDFNWQGFYFFPKYMVLDRGTQIHAYATYDNTTNNPSNPNNPPKWVSWGEGTEDEMYYLPFAFLDYRAGDENVSFEDEVVTSNENVSIHFPENKFYNIFPNPAKENITVGFSLKEHESIQMEVLDINGRVVLRPINNYFYNAGRHQARVDISQLSSGVYVLNIKGRKFVMSEQFTVK